MVVAIRLSALDGERETHGPAQISFLHIHNIYFPYVHSIPHSFDDISITLSLLERVKWRAALGVDC